MAFQLHADSYKLLIQLVTIHVRSFFTPTVHGRTQLNGIHAYFHLILNIYDVGYFSYMISQRTVQRNLITFLERRHTSLAADFTWDFSGIFVAYLCELFRALSSTSY